VEIAGPIEFGVDVAEEVLLVKVAGDLGGVD